jgi:hypothetical protein
MVMVRRKVDVVAGSSTGAPSVSTHAWDVYGWICTPWHHTTARPRSAANHAAAERSPDTPRDQATMPLCRF